ncbi:MAG TPA: hypothetical protein VM142_06865 [Acidimicrobiales bacterium]|nr:hypothetical protein [Acidimicrobiales bacterium]
MKTNKVGIGATAIVAIFLAMATAAYACTVTALQPTHDFQVTPAVVAPGGLVAAEGYCTIDSDGCSAHTAGPTTVNFTYTPCSFLPGGTPECPTEPGGHDHSTEPCSTGSSLGTGTQTMKDLLLKRVHVVTMDVTTVPSLSLGTYIVCADFEPTLMWNYMSVV